MTSPSRSAVVGTPAGSPVRSMPLATRWSLATTLMLIMCLAAVGLLAPIAAAASTEVQRGWVPASAMTMGREQHTATLLSDEKVLVVGGQLNGNAITATAELYDPATGAWTATGTMAAGRMDATATLLPDGTVLAAGGASGSTIIATAELYDPATGVWTPTDPMNTARRGHTATLLTDGTVLVAGGGNASSGPTSSAELYDPATGIWTDTSAMSVPRGDHTATLLTGGKVLVAGGLGYSVYSSADVYDPTDGTWTPAGPMAMGRTVHTATLLSDGRVLVAGGATDDGSTATAELFDPTEGTWSATGDMATARREHTANLLDDGTVLATSGFSLQPTATAELYEPASGTWSATADITTPRMNFTATTLADGTILAAGGSTYGGRTDSTERYGPTHTLTTITAGAGVGSVTSEPAGVQCGESCSNDFLEGSQLTLTATPANGAVFAGWAGACTNTSGVCQVTMDAAKTVTATFEVATHTLTVGKDGSGTGTVTSEPGGIDCGLDCSHTASHAAQVRLTATPTAGSTFAGWSGACTNATGTCDVTMDAAKVVTATFDLVPQPTMGEPALKFQSTATFPVAWAGGDNATRYDVRWRAATTTSGLGTYTRLKTGTTATQAEFDGEAGTTYCFSARGVSHSDSTSAWSAELCTSVPLDDRAMATSGPWTSDRIDGYYNGTRRFSNETGARLVASSVTTKRIAVLAVQCPGCGAIKVLFKGEQVATFNLDRPDRQRRYFNVAAFDSARTGNVAISVTSTDKRVTVDALGLSRM